MKFDRSLLKHLLPIVVFFIITSIYFAPLYSGKTLVQSDGIQFQGVGKESADYAQKGEYIHWNNREFSGVPLLKSSEYNIFRKANGLLFYGVVPKPVMMVFALFLGFYALLRVHGTSRWLSAIGGFAYAFSTFNIISVEVGHDNKVLGMAFMAPVLAGIILAYKGDYLKGALLTFISTGFQLYFGHVQITYYLLIMVIAYVIYILFVFYRNKEWGVFMKASGSLIVATLLAIGSNFGNLYSTLEYKDYSTRGGTELTSQTGEKVARDGLDKDYALSWSYGKMEAFTLIFPYFHGGASGESLSKNSNTYEVLTKNGVDRRTIESVTKNVPLYWGDQPFTAGTIYFGAVLCFLFMLGMVILKTPLKWWALSLFVLSLFLAMGRNLEWFTDIFFYNVPLYNKFRTVTMIFSITQLVVPFIGILALDQMIKDKSKEEINKMVKVALGLGGLGLFFILFKGAFFDFKGARDTAYGFPEWLISAIVADRKSLFNQDIVRSIVLVALGAGGLWFYVKGTFKEAYVIIGFGLLILFDLWFVDKRHLDLDDFQKQKNVTAQIFQPSPADLQIQKDKSYFRVLNLTSQNPFSDGVTSYFHYSVLGYSAIKMQRYQELIDRYIGKMDRGILNMLNTKYFIIKGDNGPAVQPNPEAMGNAWLVDELVVVGNADQEIAMIGELDLKSIAVFDSRYKSIVGEGMTFSGEGSVSLTSYHPERMEYSFKSDEEQFAVFSEIYFGPGWNAYIDGVLTDHLRVDYVLRGLPVPAGEHKIVFKYEPKSAVVGDFVAISIDVILALLLLMGLFLWWRNKKSLTA